jgi:hypothetical protein
MFRSLILTAFLLATVCPVRAALEWENQVVDLHPGISDESAVAHFKYKNTGDKPVTIKSVRPSCGCTTAAPPTKPIAPGESGEIVATFHIGDRNGAQTKTIQVLTDANDASTTLTLHADVPRILVLTPTFLYWPSNQPIEPKTIEAKIGGDFPVTKLSLQCTDPSVESKAELVPNEKAFRITIAPKPGNRPVNASLRIEPDFPKGKPKIFSVYLRIDAHPAATATATPK